MHAVPIPDPLYMQAQEAARATGVSLEMFVAEAVIYHLHDDPEDFQELTVSRFAVASGGDEDVDKGNGLTPEEIDARLAAIRAAWLEANLG